MKKTILPMMLLFDGSLTENRGLLISLNPATRMVVIGSEIKGKQEVILTDLSGRTVLMQTHN
jgi:hypothetical protein